MKLSGILAPLALWLIVGPVFAQDSGLESAPAAPALRLLGERHAELIGHELRSANVYAREKLTAVELAYDRGLTIGLIQTTPEVIQVAIGLITPDPGSLAVSLFCELSTGEVVGLSVSQAGVQDGDPLAGMTPAQVKGILEAFAQVTGGDGVNSGKLLAASADWRASDAEQSVGATLIEETASTKGTYEVYAQLFRTGFSFSQGYEVRTKGNGDLQALRASAAEPRGVNYVELRRHPRGGGIVTLGYDTANARALEAYLREVLEQVDEAESASVLRGAKPAAKPAPDALPGSQPAPGASLKGSVEGASK